MSSGRVKLFAFSVHVALDVYRNHPFLNILGERAHSGTPASYHDLQAGIVALLESARASAVRSVNALMTATYWEIGRRIVESEQGGEERAGYGEGLILRLAEDLTHRFERGFSPRNLEQMRLFYLSWPIPQTVSAESQALATRAPR